MIKRALYEEFFTTDSISRKAELRQMIEDAVDEAFKKLFDNSSEWSYWCFPDAEENEVGTFEKFIEDDGVQVEYKLALSGRQKFVTIPFNEFIED